MASEQEIESLVVRLRGDSSHFDAMANRFNQTIQGMVQALAGLGLGNLMRQGVAGFIEAEGITLRLEAAIRLNGHAVEETMASYQAWAKQIEKVSVAEDDASLRAIAMAESLGLTGDAAKQAVQNAMALSTIVTGSAQNFESFVRQTAALQSGSAFGVSRFLRGQLAGIEDESQKAAKAMEVLQKNFSLVEAEAKSTGGSIKSLSRDWGNFLEDIGGVVVEGIRPLIDALRSAVVWLQGLSTEAKQMMVAVAASVVGFLTLGPALSVLKVVLAPFISMLAMVPPLVMAIISPIGLTVAAIATLGVVVESLTGVFGNVFEWLKKQWGDLAGDAKIGIDGIVDAIKAGRIELAFEIAWTQVKLTFMRVTSEIQKELVIWANAVMLIFKGLGNGIQDILHKIIYGWSGIITFIGEGLGMLPEGTMEQLKQMEKNDRDAIKNAWKVAVDEIGKNAANAMDGIDRRLQDLVKKRDALVVDAAKAVADMKMPKLDNIKAPELNVKAKVTEVKWDAAEFGSAEFLTRVQSQQDKTPYSEHDNKKAVEDLAKAIKEDEEKAREQRRIANDLLKRLVDINKPKDFIGAAGIA